MLVTQSSSGEATIILFRSVRLLVSKVLICPSFMASKVEQQLLIGGGNTLFGRDRT